MDHSYLFKLLNIPDDGSIIINDVEIIADTKYVYISRPSIPSYCPNCSFRNALKGIYKPQTPCLTRRNLHHLYREPKKVEMH